MIKTLPQSTGTHTICRAASLAAHVLPGKSARIPSEVCQDGMEASSVRVLRCSLTCGQGSPAHPPPHYQHVCHGGMKVFVLRPRYTRPFERLHKHAWHFPVWLCSLCRRAALFLSEIWKKIAIYSHLGYSWVLRFIVTWHITTQIQNVYTFQLSFENRIWYYQVLEITWYNLIPPSVFFLKLYHVVIQIFY